jgi:hypothetical protein
LAILERAKINGHYWRTAITFPSNHLWDKSDRIKMSVYDSKDLMSIKAAGREFDVPAVTLELAIQQGTLRAIEQEGERWLLQPDVEQFVKRTIKQGAGNRVISSFRR